MPDDPITKKVILKEFRQMIDAIPEEYDDCEMIAFFSAGQIGGFCEVDKIDLQRPGVIYIDCRPKRNI